MTIYGITLTGFVVISFLSEFDSELDTYISKVNVSDPIIRFCQTSTYTFHYPVGYEFGSSVRKITFENLTFQAVKVSNHRHGTIRVLSRGNSEQMSNSGENEGKKMEAWVPEAGMI
jgi:hypothetical protein